ncbi:unnamed protein product [Dracunculus medinensis]|uniref:Myotubularin phosphatase domain-containing protein n=1 Tax=Dracunculus medinensis TaxID=318479 RepID=A0A0N4UFA6_DRAME|nr:unnamed protein product [Dracunculus medinensis]
MSDLSAVEHKDSFRSYVATFNNQNRPDPINDEPDFLLLKGELISSQCGDVLLDPPFRENLFGKLYCTNFRICFVPLIEKRPDPCCSRNLVFANDFQLPLCSLETIFYSSHPITKRTSSSMKRFRLMTSPASQLDIVSCIKVFSKDFRIWTFDLQRSQFAVNLANNIYHFSHPVSLSNFFHFPVEISYLDHSSSIRFNERKDWIDELRRCHADESSWRICFLHSDRTSQKYLVETYPSCVVVPSEVFDVVIIEYLIPNWSNGRFPIWCWSATNGCALLRSSCCTQDLNSSYLWERILTPICKMHPRSRRPLIISIDISPSQISNAYEKLRELCSIESVAQFLQRDKDWYSLLAETGWCKLIFDCLSVTCSVLHKITENQRSVIIADEDGFNGSVIVSSLVQICGDRYYRTIAGLNSLIEKEWIALGHPFGKNIFNCGFVYNKTLRQTTPTFLVFLDALWQLLRIFPLYFEYSQYMLIALWDLSITGLSSGLTYNSVSERLASNKVAPTFPLSQYYSSKYCAMFTNTAYSLNLLFALDPLSREFLCACASPFDIEFWTDCYLRWVPPANVKDGGKLTQDIALCSVISMAASAASPTYDSVLSRHQFHPAFDSSNINSAFPYIDTLSLAPIFNDMDIITENSSVKSMRLHFENVLPSSSKLLYERRLSGSFFLPHLNNEVEESGIPRFIASSDKHSTKKRNMSAVGTLV